MVLRNKSSHTDIRALWSPVWYAQLFVLLTREFIVPFPRGIYLHYTQDPPRTYLAILVLVDGAFYVPRQNGAVLLEPDSRYHANILVSPSPHCKAQPETRF